MESGDILNEENLKIVRPGYGLAPKYIDLFMGKKISRGAKAGTPLSWDIL
jgi:sialic acid synthase SpsE